MELMMVLALLTILMVAGITNWLAQIKKAHDSQRKSDLHKIQAMLEHFYNDHDCFPYPAGAPPVDLNNPNICGSTNFSAQGVDKYPCDPESKLPYAYVPLANCGGYRVYAKLTDLKDADIARLGCDASGCGPGGQYNYGVASDGVIN